MARNQGAEALVLEDICDDIIPAGHLAVARTALESFLANPTFYRCTTPAATRGNPRTVRSVMSSYIPGEDGGRHERMKGIGIRVYDPLVRGVYSAEGLIAKLGMTREWREYQNKRFGVPLKDIALVKQVVGKFLADPIYLSNETSNRQPMSFMDILRYFHSSTGRTFKRAGTCSHVSQAIENGNYSLQDLMEATSLKRQWKNYITPVVPEHHIVIARKVIGHFLSNPYYPIKGGLGSLHGDPWSLTGVVSNHVISMNEGRGGKRLQRGTAAVVSRAIGRGMYTERDLWNVLPDLKRRWNAYERSRGS